MMHDPERTRGLYLLIGAVSFSCLVFELSLLRVFSITLWYHFAVMVISIAMLGISASGTALAVFPGLKDLRRIPLYALLFAASLPASYLAANHVPFDPARLSWDRLQILFLSLYYLLLSIPFFLFGMIMATGFSGLPADSGRVYASDLLGAGTGSLAVLLLLSLGGPENAILAGSGLAAAAVLLTSSGRIRTVAAALVATVGVLLAGQPAVLQPRMSPYKPLSVALSFPGSEHLRTYHRPYARVDTFRSPVVRFAPGLSISYLEALPAQTGLTVDGGGMDAVTDASDPARLEFLEHLPAALPYRLAHPEDVLVIDPRGGLEVLAAQRLGAASIETVESNPILLRVVRDLDAASGRRQPGVRSHTGTGRAWLASTQQRFDVISLPLTGALPAAGTGLGEDHRLTSEAFTGYLRHLKPEGILSVTHYILPPPRAELRTLATMAEAAGRLGLGDVASRCIIVRSWGTVTLLFSRSPFSGEQVRAAKQFCRENRFDLLHYPGIAPDEGSAYIRMRGDDYRQAFNSILSPERREAFLRNHLFDVRPVHDRDPFAHYYLKLGNIREIYESMGEKVQFFFEEGYLLPVLLLQVLLIGTLLVIAPLFVRKRSRAGPEERRLRAWPCFFASLGLAYLLVEVGFLQQSVLVLEHPSYAASTVIAALLAGSGAGSWSSQRLPVLRTSRTLLVLAVVVALYALVLLPQLTMLGALRLPLRVLSVFLLLLPAGFLMGIPLPLGIMLLGERGPRRIPWAWAVNGFFSVLAPILALMIALSAGFTAVALLGAVLYAAAAVVMRQWERDGKAGGASA